jgi:hypothetical protein
MTVIGFNFNKILVERRSNKSGKLTISNNVAINDVSEAKVPFSGDKARCIKFEFSFDSKYEPDIATIHLTGELLYMLPQEAAEKTLAEWKEKKRLSQDVIGGIMNTILNRCNIEALILSRELNLPSPIPLPKVNIDVKRQ